MYEGNYNKEPKDVENNESISCPCERYLELEEENKKLGRLHDQLIRQEKMATLGQLTAGVAHEINNPLGFVASNFNTLKKYIHVFKEIIKEYEEFKAICSEKDLEHCGGIVNKIKKLEEQYQLDFIEQDVEELLADTQDGFERISKIVAGLRMFSHSANEDEIQEYDLNEGIKNTLVIARNEIKYYAEVYEEFGEIPLIEASGGNINQVILNMLINSVHAIKEKGIFGEVKITTRSDDKCVYCTIEDNGIGIEKENLEKVKEPFFTTKAVGIGTGLGLSISHDIIMIKHNGKIEIESERGKGTKICIQIPIKHA